MAQQTIVASRACYLDTGSLTPAVIATGSVAVNLDDRAGVDNADGIPTVRLADGSNSVIYGKLDVDASNWDALNPTSVDTDGDVTYPTMGAVIVDGIVTFPISTVAVSDIGSGIVGAAGNTVAADADGSGKIITVSGGTAWVDLRA